MDYLPPGYPMGEVLKDSERAYIARYALGRDYHKLMRQRLKKLAERITQEIGPFQYRALVDSAPVLEKPLGEKAGVGWIGKHTNLVNRRHGSWFFLGELYTDLPLATDVPSTPHCGRCRACIDVCPTGAIVAPYQLDARLCISYLTIEHRGVIPEPLRPQMGNRIFGCDDCQLVCPWNRFARSTREVDFHPRHGLDDVTLLSLFAWNETTFLQRFEGSPIRRLGHQRWQRNIAVALGNAPPSDRVVTALRASQSKATDLVRIHIDWALQRHLESL
jgi:epoxyqueuosine reductase